jgi:sigma-B regulation protein RsbU (phosphoserine phosphatase)
LDRLPEIPDVEFAYDHVSATSGTNIGGDFYDLFRMADGRLGLMIGDVAGQGVEASRIALMVKDTINAFASEDPRPGKVLTQVNSLLGRRSIPGFVTAFLGFLDTEAGVLTYASAGHPAPLLSVAGSVRSLDVVPAPPLGALPGTSYSHSVYRLPEATALLLYTDGLTEARRDGAFYGEEGLARAFGQNARLSIWELPWALIQDALTFSGGTIKDDAAVLTVRYRGPAKKGYRVDPL